VSEDFVTPREAALAAELKETKAKLLYLARASGVDETSLSPVAMVDKYTVRGPPTSLMIPIAGIRGRLVRHNNHHVVGIASMGQAEEFHVTYSVPATNISTEYQLNRLLPELHRLLPELHRLLPELHRMFLGSLAEAMPK
jgi:hypothetical protein